LAALAGGVGWTAFPGIDFWPAAIVSIALLVAALAPLGPGLGYLAAVAYGWALFGPLLWWSDVAAGAVPWAILTTATALLVGIVGLAWPLARRIQALGRSVGLGAAGFALIWLAVEELRAVFPVGGFPWGRLAFSQAGSPLARIAWLGGSPLTSFAVALAGALAAGVVARALAGRTWAACGAAVAALVIVAAPAAIPLDARAEAGSLRVAAIQGGGEQALVDDGVPRRSAVFQLHAGLAGALAQELGPDALDVMIWPEDSVGFDLGERPELAAEVGELAAAAGAPTLIGAAEYPETGGRYNVSLLLDGDGQVIGRYAKRHPVPFGEYVPFRSLARRVTAATDRVQTDMLAGSEVGVIDLPVARTGGVVPLGVVICFEVVHDTLVTDAVRAGAQLLVVQTNNASFGRTSESVQQLAMSRLRAIEQGRTVVHVSTTGVSAVISPSGIVLDEVGAFTPGTMVQTVPLRTTLTPAARWGSALGWAGAALGAAITAAGAWLTVRGRAKRRKV
jgi:apolipoprotein N-acyltransferase